MNINKNIFLISILIILIFILIILLSYKFKRELFEEGSRNNNSKKIDMISLIKKSISNEDYFKNPKYENSLILKENHKDNEYQNKLKLLLNNKKEEELNYIEVELKKILSNPRSSENKFIEINNKLIEFLRSELIINIYKDFLDKYHEIISKCANNKNANSTEKQICDLLNKINKNEDLDKIFNEVSYSGTIYKQCIDPKYKEGNNEKLDIICKSFNEKFIKKNIDIPKDKDLDTNKINNCKIRGINDKFKKNFKNFEGNAKKFCVSKEFPKFIPQNPNEKICTDGRDATEDSPAISNSHSITYHNKPLKYGIDDDKKSIVFGNNPLIHISNLCCSSECF